MWRRRRQGNPLTGCWKSGHWCPVSLSVGKRDKNQNGVVEYEYNSFYLTRWFCWLLLRMYKSKGECPEKAASWRVENPSRVVIRGSAPYLSSTRAIGKLLARQDSCRAVLPSQLNWLTLTSEEPWDDKKDSIADTSPSSITDSNWRCSRSLGTGMSVVQDRPMYGRVVTGLKGCNISSYLLAYLGLWLINSDRWPALPILYFLFLVGLGEQTGELWRGEEGARLSPSSDESDWSWSEKAGE